MYSSWFVSSTSTVKKEKTHVLVKYLIFSGAEFKDTSLPGPRAVGTVACRHDDAAGACISHNLQVSWGSAGMGWVQPQHLTLLSESILGNRGRPQGAPGGRGTREGANPQAPRCWCVTAHGHTCPVDRPKPVPHLNPSQRAGGKSAFSGGD